MRALLTNHSFTISVFVAVAITAMFAFVFEAAPELVPTLLVLGVPTQRRNRSCVRVRSTRRDRHNIDSSCIGKRE